MLVEVQNRISVLEDSLLNSYQANLVLKYDPEIALLDLFLLYLKGYNYTKICSEIFIADIFIFIHPEVSEDVLQ